MWSLVHSDVLPSLFCEVPQKTLCLKLYEVQHEMLSDKAGRNRGKWQELFCQRYILGVLLSFVNRFCFDSDTSIENKHIYIYIYIEDLSSRHTVIRLFRSLDFGFTILSFRLRCFESSSEVRGLRGVRCFRPSSDAERFLSRIEFASASCCCLS